VSFREYWFTYSCVFLTGCLIVFVYSVLRDFIVWGRITVLDLGFWECLLPYNLFVFILAFLVALGIVYASNTIKKKKALINGVNFFTKYA
jgi:hypothetical protein